MPSKKKWPEYQPLTLKSEIPTEKLLKESGDKMKEEDKKELETKLEDLKKIKDSDNIDEIKKKMEEMNEVAQKIGTAMYQQQAQSASASDKATEDKSADKQAGSEQAKGDEKVDDKKDSGPVEGEFEEKK